MVTAVDLQNRYAFYRSVKRLRNVINDRVQQDALNVDITRAQVVGVWSYGFQDAHGNDQGVVSEADAATVITRMQSLYFQNHGDVKGNGTWQTLYRRAQRQVPFMDAAGNIANAPALGLWSYPCHYCGIILPEELIQVDHQKPQAFPGLGVLKLFHSMTIPGGTLLTTAAAQGAKNTQINAILGLGGGLVPIPVKAKAFAAGWAEKAPNLARNDRYSLSDHGKTILTLIEMLWSVGSAESLGVNSLLNLVPACPKCNNAKRDKKHGH